MRKLVLTLVVCAGLASAAFGQANPLKNLNIPGGIKIGPYDTADYAATAGSLQYSGGQVQYHNGTGWVPLTASGVGYWATNTVDGGIMYGDNVYSPDIFTDNSAYSASWNGSTNVPTRDDVYDKIETLSAVEYTAPYEGDWVDDMEYIYATGGTATGPVSATYTAATDVVLGTWFSGDLQGGNPNNPALPMTFTVYDSDFGFDPVAGPTGTVLYTFPLTPSVYPGSVYGDVPESGVFDPPFSVTNGQVFTFYWAADDAVTPTWAGTRGIVYYSRVAAYNPSTDFNLAESVQYGGGTATTNSGKYDATVLGIWSATNDAQAITELERSNTIDIDVVAGALSLNDYDQPLLATTNFASNVIDIMANSSTNLYVQASSWPGAKFRIIPQQEFTLNGIVFNMPSATRGHLLNWSLESPQGTWVYRAGQIDDTAGSGRGDLAMVFPSPLVMDPTEDYVWKVSFADAGVALWSLYGGTSGGYSDAYVEIKGARASFDSVDPAVGSGAIFAPDMKLILADLVADTTPVTIIEQGDEIVFTQTGNVLNIGTTPHTIHYPLELDSSTTNAVTLDQTELDDLRYLNWTGNSGLVGSGPKTYSLRVTQAFEAKGVVTRAYYGVNDIITLQIWDLGSVDGSGYITTNQFLTAFAGSPMWDGVAEGQRYQCVEYLDLYPAFSFNPPLSFEADRAYAITFISEPDNALDNHDWFYTSITENLLDTGSYHTPAQTNGMSVNQSISFYHTDWETDITTGGAHAQTYGFPGYFVIDDSASNSVDVSSVRIGNGLNHIYNSSDESLALSVDAPSIAAGYGATSSILHSNFTVVGDSSTYDELYGYGEMDRVFFQFEALDTWTMLGIRLDAYLPDQSNRYYSVHLWNEDVTQLLATMPSSTIYTQQWVDYLFTEAYEVQSGERYSIEVRADISYPNRFFLNGYKTGGSLTYPSQATMLGYSGHLGAPTTPLYPFDELTSTTVPAMYLIEGDDGLEQIGGIVAGDGVQVSISSGLATVSLDPVVEATSIAVDYVQLDTTFTNGSAPGRLQWGIDNGFPEIGLPGGTVNLQIGEEHLLRVWNNTGATITNGLAVAITGVSNGTPTVAYADASSATLAEAIGVATEDIADNTNGYIVISGVVHGLDTSAFSPSDVVYLDATGNGTYTAARAAPPSMEVHVGHVLTSDASDGSIYVDVYAKPDELVNFAWATHDLGTDAVDVWGTYEEDVLAAETIATADTAIVPAVSAVNRHIVLEVTSGADTDGTITWTGSRVDENTGVVSLTNEVMTISGTGFYQTGFKWLGATTGTTSTVNLTGDIHTTTYLDAQNTDFALKSVRFAFKPTSATWDIECQVLHVANDGSYSNCAPLLSYANTDTVPRTYSGVQGHGKQLLNIPISGSNNAGLILRITGKTAGPSAIGPADVLIGAIK
jgi:hypothetical protein